MNVFCHLSRRQVISMRVGRPLGGRGATQARLLSSSAYLNVKNWATVDPDTLAGGEHRGRVLNFVNGEWQTTPSRTVMLPDPLDGSQEFLEVADTPASELGPFVESLAACPKYGLHNPFRRTDQYVKWGEVTHRLAQALGDPAVALFFQRAIQRTCPKSAVQAQNEVRVTQAFLRNFAGDGVRFLAGGQQQPGDHVGQSTTGWRWPFGPVALVSPFNFPLEIPVLQLMGAVYMGNKVCLKPAPLTGLVAEQWLRLMHACGAPPDAVDLLHCEGPVMGELIARAPVRLTQFTGSSRVAEHLGRQTGGRVRIEDAGFDWKILGPDVPEDEAARQWVAYTCDQDAYACSGQKCSAQSMLFVHENWARAGLADQLGALAGRRSLAKLTVGPTLTHTTASLLEHTERLAALPGARLLWGGQPLADDGAERIPAQYGAVQPTAVQVPLSTLMSSAEAFTLCCTEMFGPFQVLVEYGDDDLDLVLRACERMSHHLTAAVVSNDPLFVNRVLGRSVNGTTYVGMRARTTGAPQNHWFGPAGDPRGAGIGTHDAIRLVWSTNREVVHDYGPCPEDPDAMIQS